MFDVIKRIVLKILVSHENTIVFYPKQNLYGYHSATKKNLSPEHYTNQKPIISWIE